MDAASFLKKKIILKKEKKMKDDGHEAIKIVQSIYRSKLLQQVCM